MKKNYILFVVLLQGLSLYAQELSFQSQPVAGQAPAATVNVRQIVNDFAPMLVPLEAPAPNSNSYRAYLQQAKKELEARFPRREGLALGRRSSTPPPVPGQSFSGNSQNRGVPLDTHMGISNDGQIVCVINNDLLIQDTVGNVLRNVSLDVFWSSLNVAGFLFDPKIYYDPEEDRWVMAMMSRDQGTLATGFHMAFSQSNDALGAWNLYSFEGNPFNNNTWADYPMLSIGAHEVFLTVNSIREGEPWETGFEETLLHQIDKFSGYRGDTLRYRLWSGIKFGLLVLRNLCPVKGGPGLYGPTQYFLSNRNFDPVNQAFFIVTLSDTMNAPGVTLTASLRVSDKQYFFPPTARQPASSRLATNDSRVLDAFYFNNRIQFVCSVMDTLAGRPAIYHGVMENVKGAQQIFAHLISQDSFDLGYPSIAFTGSADTAFDDQDAMIFFDYSSASHFAGTGAVYAEQPGSYSDVIRLRQGENLIDILNGEERWGDYTACQRRYNQPAQVWAMGTYGLLDQTHAAWVSEVYKPVPFTAVPEPLPSLDLTTFPNPAREYVSIELDIPPGKELNISLYDLQGRHIRTFVDYVPRQPGRTRFSFATNPLANGVYLLKVSTEDGALESKKIVVNR